jgi:hypothetical protein
MKKNYLDYFILFFVEMLAFYSLFMMAAKLLYNIDISITLYLFFVFVSIYIRDIKNINILEHGKKSISFSIFVIFSGFMMYLKLFQTYDVKISELKNLLFLATLSLPIYNELMYRRKDVSHFKKLHEKNNVLNFLKVLVERFKENRGS